MLFGHLFIHAHGDGSLRGPLMTPGKGMGVFIAGRGPKIPGMAP